MNKTIIVSCMLLALNSTCIAIAETYQWTDENGTLNFTENIMSVPSKYRKKALSEARESMQSTPESRAAEAKRNSDAIRQSKSDEKRMQYLKARNQQSDDEIEAKKQSKVECSGIPGECGVGRSCVIQRSYKKTVRFCASNAEADRLVEESRRQAREYEQEQRDMAIKNTLDSIERKTSNIENDLRWKNYRK